MNNIESMIKSYIPNSLILSLEDLNDIKTYHYNPRNGRSCWTPGDRELALRENTLRAFFDDPDKHFGKGVQDLTNMIERFIDELDENNVFWFSMYLPSGLNFYIKDGNLKMEPYVATSRLERDVDFKEMENGIAIYSIIATPVDEYIIRYAVLDHKSIFNK